MILSLFFFSVLVFCKQYILTPKQNNVQYMNLAVFNEEHNIEELATFGDLTIYKTQEDNLARYKNTFNAFYDIEEEPDQFKVQESVPWHLDRISKRELPLDGTYAYNSPGSCHKNSDVEIETVVVDTGVDQTHPEFEGRAEFLENFSGDGIDTDCNSHGTFCSSQIGGLKAGVCKSAKLFAVKVLDCDGSGNTSGVIAGMDYVFKRHLKNEKKNSKLRTIMSMSLGGGYSRSMNMAIERMVTSSDTFYIVVASGNENSNACNTSPASARGILTVNAMNRNDQRAYFSNFGKCTDIYSPGVSNYGAVLNGKYAVESGTSFSTPILAGVMNHVLDENPFVNMKQLKEKILSDATKDIISGNKKQTPNLMVFLKRNDDDN